ncbi:extracellular calcium-sensing receptor-like [Orycteropus afer afer]|uniref:Extracellular calcium-sensing receptor-like n=1 Tax=Orycteropus afer afer TaxID=1230840 RepID=A0A8B7B5K9_ORYAF|nr:extracellular calcium-sensing receptor-like [Orycteropus afer afer]
MWGYRLAQGFVFAIEEINRDSRLLPNLTLGFSIWNSGDSVSRALQEAMGFLTGQEEPIPNYVCQASPPRAALVGDSRSALSIPLARLLGLYKFPQVSYASTLASLSDKTQFPSFLRTVASDLTCSYMVAQLVLHFRWFWVGVLAQDDDHGQQGSALVTWELVQAGVCIEFHLLVPSKHSLEKTQAIIRKMEVGTAKNILVFLSNSNFHLVLQGLLGRGVLGRVWVSQDTLHSVLALAIPGISQVLQCSFSLMPHHKQVSGFPEFLAHLHPTRNPGDIFTKRFWEVTFGCTWPHSSLRPAGNSTATGGVRFCLGNESLRGLEYPFQNVSNVDVAYSAVYSIAHALQDLVSCEHGNGPCADTHNFQPWQLLHRLRNVHFNTPDGREISIFYSNGDIVTEFDILYGQKTPEDLFTFVHAGTISQQASSGERVSIHWTKEEPQVPSSVCSASCTPGSSQIPLQGAPHCCFECSSQTRQMWLLSPTDMKQCLPCPMEQYSSQARDHCLPRTENFLAFDEPLGLTLTVASLTLASLALLVLVVFLKYQHTPVVRANNRALSYTLLASLALCALCPLLFLGRPTVATCLLRQTTFATVFTVALSSVLAKTLTVVLAFRVTRPGGRVRVCLGYGASASVVLMASLIQVILCGVWLGTSPPFPDRDTASEPSLVVVQCHEGSGAAFSRVLGYLGLLAGGTFSVAFLARGLPDAFNETKFLTFSMLLFCSVWVAFLPLYYSARGKATVAMEIFSILMSSAGLLCGIFMPKCYVILLKPKRNTPARLSSGRQAQ